MKKAFFIGLMISLVSGISQATPTNFSCKVNQIKDEDAVMYFELEKGSLIHGNFKTPKITVGALYYTGSQEVKVRTSGVDYAIQFKDPESGIWTLEISYASGIGALKDSDGVTQVLSNCAWQLGMDPFRQPDIAL